MGAFEHSHGESVRTNVDCTAKKRDETNEMQERERPKKECVETKKPEQRKSVFVEGVLPPSLRIRYELRMGGQNHLELRFTLYMNLFTPFPPISPPTSPPVLPVAAPNARLIPTSNTFSNSFALTLFPSTV